MKKEKISWIYRIWKEGRYVDLWNLPHFLISLLIGFVFIYFNFSFYPSIILIILIKIIWEIYEHVYVIKEAIPNKILDVVTGILAIIFAFHLKNIDLITLKIIFITFLLELFFGSWGMYSAKKLNLLIKKK